MNLLVTGGNGFIGRRLVQALDRTSHIVKILSRKSGIETPSGIEVVQGDLTALSFPLQQLVEDCDIVFHCAGEIRNPADMKPLHVDATQRLLAAAKSEALRRGRPVHWVQLSSVGIYGPPEQCAHMPRIVTEESRINPVGEYEITKSISDDLVIKASQPNLLTYSIVRPSNVFGQNMTNQSLREMGAMIRKGLFFYIGRPGAIATYVHLDDVVAVLLRCAFEPRARGKIFNVSNDCALEELVDSIAEALAVRAPRLRLPEKPIRILTGLMAGINSVPLTRERIDALVSRTRYPADQLERELGYKLQKNVPECIAEVL